MAKLEPGELEVFRAGDYPQGKFTRADLQAMAASYNPTQHEAPVFYEHQRDPDTKRPRGAAAGYIERLRVEGDTLVGRLSFVGDKLKQDMQAGWRKWSAEIYPGRGGNPPRLRAVALLGAEVPQVKGLGHALFADEHGEQFSVVFMEADTEAGTTPAAGERELEGTTVADEKNKDEQQPKGEAAPVPAEFAERMGRVEQELAEAKRALAIANEGVALERSLREAEAKKATAERVRMFSEEQVAAGRLTPADVADGKLAAFMESLGAVKFTAGDAEVDGLTYFREFITNRPAVVPGGVRHTEGSARGGVGGRDVPENAAPETVQFHEQVMRYAKENDVEYAVAFDAVSAVNPLYTGKR